MKRITIALLIAIALVVAVVVLIALWGGTYQLMNLSLVLLVIICYLGTSKRGSKINE